MKPCDTEAARWDGKTDGLGGGPEGPELQKHKEACENKASARSPNV